jgi:WD40 repeat protein
MPLVQIYVWSVKTGRLLDVLAGHEGPVSALAFCPTQPLLASCSWDRCAQRSLSSSDSCCNQEECKSVIRCTLCHPYHPTSHTAAWMSECHMPLMVGA